RIAGVADEKAALKFEFVIVVHEADQKVRAVHGGNQQGDHSQVGSFVLSIGSMSYSFKYAPPCCIKDAWVPICTILPASRTTIWSASLIVLKRCAIATTIALDLSELMASCTALSVRLSNALVASSRMRISGLTKIAR